MFEKIPFFIQSHPILTGCLLGALCIALFLELRKGGSPVTITELTGMMNKNQVIVVDIRPEKDYRAGHINDSVNIPFDKLSSQVAMMSNQKEKTTVLVCATGMQSKSSVERLQEMDIKAKRLAGGIAEWTGANIPLTKS